MGLIILINVLINAIKAIIIIKIIKKKRKRKKESVIHVVKKNIV